MLRINSIKLNPGYTDDELYDSILRRLKIGRDELISVRLVKRSIDARDKDNIKYVICADVAVGQAGSANPKLEKKILSDRRIKDVSVAETVKYKDISISSDSGHKFSRPVIAGFGPAGMICAYKLAEAGLRPIVLERGLDVDRRTEKVNSFWKGGALDENTNVQFGEGGAGTFSDGKLSTMIHDKVGRIGEFFRILVENGADGSILYNAKPHVGTDRLSVIVKNIRQKIIELGGEVRFGSKLKDIITDSDGKLYEIIVENIYEDNETYGIKTDSLVLAVGHSARDTFEMLHDKGFMMEQKAFAAGVRVQHPQELIGFSQYGKDYKKLPAADYKLTYQSERLNRGVYSFCMCPGGFVVNSSSENGRLVVNGMSNSDRGEQTANSAIVVNVDRRDFDSDAWNAGIEFQRKLEEKAFNACCGRIPVQRYGDFRSKYNFKLKENNFMPIGKNNDAFIPNSKGLWEYGDMHDILPSQLCDAIAEAFPDFGRRIHGFDSPDALLMGVESRTSSPVRITRNDSLEAVGFEGIYPCGEGAGYAGGITSAAVDGIRVYEAIIGKIPGKESKEC